MYDLERLKAAAQEQMPERRWLHTLGVREAAMELAERYNADRHKAEVAALLHDYCKYWPIEKQRHMIIEQQLPAELLDHDSQLWHAPVGALVVEQELGVADLEILDAIRYHTSGRIRMSLLEKVICLADYIEPGRDFPGVERMRTLAKTSLEQALLAGFDSTISFLIERGKKIFPLTIMARNGLLDELKQRR